MLSFLSHQTFQGRAVSFLSNFCDNIPSEPRQINQLQQTMHFLLWFLSYIPPCFQLTTGKNRQLLEENLPNSTKKKKKKNLLNHLVKLSRKILSSKRDSKSQFHGLNHSLQKNFSPWRMNKLNWV